MQHTAQLPTCVDQAHQRVCMQGRHAHGAGLSSQHSTDAWQQPQPSTPMCSQTPRTWMCTAQPLAQRPANRLLPKPASTMPSAGTAKASISWTSFVANKLPCSWTSFVANKLPCCPAALAPGSGPASPPLASAATAAAAASAAASSSSSAIMDPAAAAVVPSDSVSTTCCVDSPSLSLLDRVAAGGAKRQRRGGGGADTGRRSCVPAHRWLWCALRSVPHRGRPPQGVATAAQRGIGA